MTLLGSDRTRLGPLTGRVAGLRVGFVGESGARTLSAGLATPIIRPDTVRSLGQRLGWLDVLVLDDKCEGFDRRLMEQTVQAARAMGARVAGISGTGPTPVWSGLVDTILGSSDAEPILLAPVVDPRRVNPVGYRSGRPAVKGALEAIPIPEIADDAPAEDPASLIESLRPALAAELQPSAGTDDLEAARWLIHLAAAGVPLICEITPGIERIIGSDLTTLIRSTTEARCRDTNERDLISIRCRRVALQQHSTSRRWQDIAERLGLHIAPLPTVSVLLCTNRPPQLRHALEQVARQTYTPCELVLVLHGSDFPADPEEQVGRTLTIPHRVVRVPASMSYGAALNEGLATSTGAIVTKMDDDDWYGREHLWDLVLALDYSGADLVGKLQPHFVYLSALDVTVRRRIGRSEAFGTAISGGTMMLRRQDLEAVGGYRDGPCDDMGLIRDIQGDGGRVYQTHGHGYIYQRRGSGHTWDSGDDVVYYLPVSGFQARGLAREAADL